MPSAVVWTAEMASHRGRRKPFWAGLNKARSIQVDLRSDAGRDLVTQLITEGPDNGIFLSNFPNPVGFLMTGCDPSEKT